LIIVGGFLSVSFKPLEYRGKTAVVIAIFSDFPPHKRKEAVTLGTASAKLGKN
jgi:hypothetical protein